VVSLDTGGTKVLLSLSGSDTSTDKDSVRSLRGAQSQLIEGKDLTTVLDDTGAGSLRDSEGDECKLGDLVDSQIVGDGT
jgi:hypothetical protein